MSIPMNKNYPYLELDLIDYIYNYSTDQYISSEDMINYIKEEHGMIEVERLQAEANRRFIYKSNNKKFNVGHEFDGSMPIEYVRDIILSCFFLGTQNDYMNNFSYVSSGTLDKNSIKEFGYAFYNTSEVRDDRNYIKISNMQNIVSSDGIRLCAGFLFNASVDHNKTIEENKYVRMFGTATLLTMNIGRNTDSYITDYLRIRYTGVDGVTKLG